MITRTIPWVWCALLFGCSFFLGALYSMTHADPHHWGFIVSTAWDFIQGHALFTEVNVQYGVGQIRLFAFLNQLITINITSVGWVTAAVYGAHLVLIFAFIRQLTTRAYAFLFSGLAILMHTHIVLPWPDYFAGFFLTLGLYVLVRFTSLWGAFLAGTSFFVTFYFRNTYALTLVAAALGYGICVWWLRLQRSRQLVRSVSSAVVALSLGVSFLFVGLYLLQLYSAGELALWYQQGFAVSQSAHYHVGIESVVKLLSRAFFPIRTHWAGYLAMLVMAGMLHGILYWLVKFLRGSSDAKKSKQGVSLFLTLTPLAGLIQALHGYDIFRVQNACASIYPVTAFLLFKRYPTVRDLLTSRRNQVVAVIIAVLLGVRFPDTSAHFPFIEGAWRDYTSSPLPYFKWHRFQKQEAEYFEGLSNLIALASVASESRVIVNLTMDSTVPYLQDTVRPYFKVPFYHRDTLVRMDEQSLKKIDEGRFEVGQIVVSESASLSLLLAPSQAKRVQLIGSVYRPKGIRYLDPAMVYVHLVGLK